ncbi:hypothetical protein HPP92_019084 [Vanilla planifolia]|uniref:Uncharacterized protein n=1 Tax=Vanilla planifolia TaxID=51239 RepID=A0A835ULC5_VANPL|nr:hypothetical protein HPP92_019084 [Vanilla planifolia]
MSDALHEPGKVAEDKESPSPNVDETIARTNQFHFLDRGAIPTPPDSSAGPWRVCSVTQVEELKILLRMLPIILTTVFMNVCLAQLLTFSIHQGSTMNTRLPATTVHIPVPSLTAIPLAVMFLLIPLYDRAFVPLTRRLTGIPTGIRHLQRVGIGLVLATASMAIAGFVELRRKEVSRRHPGAVPLPMSVFWLGIQFGFLGAADMFTFVGLLEFFYAESAQRMRSLSTSVSWVSLSMGYFGSTAVVDAVNWVTAGWLTSNDLDEDKLEYFYWLLAGVSAVNFGGYLVCASWYRSRKVEGEKEEWSGLARGRWSGEKGNKECQKPIEQ